MNGRNIYLLYCILHCIVYDAFEHWKELVKLVCFSEQALSTHSDLFTNFISKPVESVSLGCQVTLNFYRAAVLHFQLKEVPDDFFVDIVSRNNFLTTTLQASIKEPSCMHEAMARTVHLC